MKNYKVKIAYVGTNYHGFQRQKNGVTVQSAIEDALKKLFLKDIIIYGCSRTDSGVHANEYYFSFMCDDDIKINERGIVFGLNTKLNSDIAVLSCESVPLDFHARYSCKGKEYKYIILNSEIRNPFLSDRAFKYWYRMDDKLIQEAAQCFVGTHDFKSFCARRSGVTNTVRTIHSFDIKRENDIVTFTISGDGFLYNMVRIIIGTLLFVNEGKISIDKLKEILEKKDRKLAGKTAPASGLYLNKVFY